MLVNSAVTDMVLSAFYDVYNTLGYGFLENVYQNALYKELKRRGLKCEAQKKIEVYYKGEVVGLYYADLLVENSVMLELKSVGELTEAHCSQLGNYLKATDIEVGLLLNFGPKPIFKRKVYSNYSKVSLQKAENNNDEDDWDTD